MKLYRACSFKYLHDLSGAGARINGGRWNSVGKAALYTSDEYAVKDLPAGWNAYPVPISITRLGDRWLTDGKILLLKVPSVIVPSEYNVIINPAHPDFNKIKITATEKLAIDKRTEQNL